MRKAEYRTHPWPNTSCCQRAELLRSRGEESGSPSLEILIEVEDEGETRPPVSIHVIEVLVVNDAASRPSTIDMGPIDIATVVLVAPPPPIDTCEFSDQHLRKVVFASLEKLIVELLAYHPNAAFGP